MSEKKSLGDKIKIKFLPVILILASLTISCTEKQADKIKLKVVSMPYPTFASFYIAQEEGFFREEGLEVEFVNFTTIPHAVPLLAQGQIDVAAGPISAGLINIIAGSADIRIVAGREYLDPDESNNATKLMVEKGLYDSGSLDEIKEIKGKKVAVPSIGTLQDFALTEMLKQADLTLKDIKLVTMPPNDAIAALKSGSVDAATLGYTQGLSAKKMGIAKQIIPQDKIMAGYQQGFIFFGPSLLKNNKDTGIRFLRAYLKGIKQYREGKTERNVEIISKYIGWDKNLLMETIWNPIYPDARINVEDVMSFQQWLYDIDLIEKQVPAESLIDLSFLESAARGIKIQ